MRLDSVSHERPAWWRTATDAPAGRRDVNGITWASLPITAVTNTGRTLPPSLRSSLGPSHHHISPANGSPPIKSNSASVIGRLLLIFGYHASRFGSCFQQFLQHIGISHRVS